MPLLFLAALTGLYAQSGEERLRVLGKLGFVVGFVGLALGAGGHVGLLLFDSLWFVFVLGLLIAFIALVTLGIDAIQASMVPRWNALPLALGCSACSYS